MAEWRFLTNHARTLVLIARDPDAAYLRTIAHELDVTERTAYGIVVDLARDGYIVKHKEGRRNRYTVHRHLPLPERASTPPTVGDLLGLLIDAPTPT
jgi:DNA-binding MarR family transcriptional regulator